MSAPGKSHVRAHVEQRLQEAFEDALSKWIDNEGGDERTERQQVDAGIQCFLRDFDLMKLGWISKVRREWGCE